MSLEKVGKEFKTVFCEVVLIFMYFTLSWTSLKYGNRRLKGKRRIRQLLVYVNYTSIGNNPILFPIPFYFF